MRVETILSAHADNTAAATHVLALGASSLLGLAKPTASVGKVATVSRATHERGRTHIYTFVHMYIACMYMVFYLVSQLGQLRHSSLHYE